MVAVKVNHSKWDGKIPWGRAWQPILVFSPGESHGQRSLAGYSLRDHRVGHDWATKYSIHSTWGTRVMKEEMFLSKEWVSSAVWSYDRSRQPHGVAHLSVASCSVSARCKVQHHALQVCTQRVLVTSLGESWLHGLLVGVHLELITVSPLIGRSGETAGNPGPLGWPKNPSFINCALGTACWSNKTESNEITTHG